MTGLGTGALKAFNAFVITPAMYVVTTLFYGLAFASMWNMFIATSLGWNELTTRSAVGIALMISFLLSTVYFWIGILIQEHGIKKTLTIPTSLKSFFGAVVVAIIWGISLLWNHFYVGA